MHQGKDGRKKRSDWQIKEIFLHKSIISCKHQYFTVFLPFLVFFTVIDYLHGHPSSIDLFFLLLFFIIYFILYFWGGGGGAVGSAFKLSVLYIFMAKETIQTWVFSGGSRRTFLSSTM